MFLIAIPKAAGTSLSQTIALAHGIPRAGGWQCGVHTMNLAVPEAYPLIAEIHKCTREYTAAAIRKIVGLRRASHLHIPPTPNNVFELRTTRKIVLLRDPSEIASAYCREAQKGFRGVGRVFIGAKGEKGWIEACAKSGLTREHEMFYAGWIAAEDKNTMIVHMPELLRDPQRTIAAIEQFLGLPLSGVRELARERYTRESR